MARTTLTGFVAAGFFALALLSPCRAFAQQLPAPVGPLTFFPNNQTVTTPLPSLSTDRDGIIGFARIDPDGTFQEESSPTITFATNGSYRRSLYVYHSSQLVIDGGAVSDNTTSNRVYGLDSSMTSLRAGLIREYRGFETSRFDMIAGELRFASAFENANLNFAGGRVGAITTLDTPTVTISGVSAVGILNIGGGTVSMSGGEVISQALPGVGNGTVIGSGGATVNLSNVDVEVSVSAVENSSGFGATVNVSGGTIGGAAARASSQGGSTVNLSNTSSDFVSAEGGGLVRITNTTVTGPVFVGLPGTGAAVNGSILFESGTIGDNVSVIGEGVFAMRAGSVARDVLVSEKGFGNLSGTGGVVAGVVSVTDQGSALVEGISVTASLRAAKTAKVEFISGFVGQDLTAADTSDVTMSGGLVARNVLASGESSVFLNGGLVSKGLAARERSVVFANGGTVGEIATAEQNARLEVNGATVSGNVSSRAVSSIAFRGGILAKDLDAFDSSTVEMTGGRVLGILASQDNSTVNLVGGTVGTNLLILGNSTFNMFGGVVAGAAYESDNATFNRYGGVIIGDDFDPVPVVASLEPMPAPLMPVMLASGASTLNIFGIDLAAELVDANYQGTHSLYHLTGRLADGGELTEYFAIQNGSGASYHLVAVPEPSGLLLTIAALPLAARRRAPRSRNAGSPEAGAV